MMTRNKVVPDTGDRNGFSQLAALGSDYAKPQLDQVDALLQIAGLLHDCGQLHLEHQRAQFDRHAQALARAFDGFKTDLEDAHILPCEEWAEERGRAWQKFLWRIHNDNLPEFVVATAQMFDQEVRP